MCLPSVRTGVEGGVAAGGLLETELAGASILLADVVPSLCRGFASQVGKWAVSSTSGAWGTDC